ncbi:MAG: fibrobacter succinogenes major paralogous domain-containing protein [Flavobacteriaceae bacterium]|nr:fibrobacter succinogenes major paralogous domain-containing protein [Flavobacteriaceae bacterium]
MKKLLYTLFTTVLFTATAFSQGEQRYANGSATDQDGNTFEWINYGTQDWAIEKSEVVTYRDGTEIPQVTDNTAWSNLTTGAWCYYDNDPSKGKLYNWYAVMGIHDTDPNTPNKEFAPEGWRVPTDAEWFTLENYLIANGYNYDGTTTGNKIAKSMASTTGWNSSSNTGAIGNEQSLNNSSGFNAFPEGYRTALGGFGSDGRDAVFWSSSEFEMDNAWMRNLYHNSSTLDSDYGMGDGFSVRFVRDASSIGANGSILLNGTVSAENNQIKNVADPTEAQDVTTKNYVDNSVSNTYTQAEVDALISSLQEQIDALQTTTGSGTVTDQDGNSYPYLNYGDQLWTLKNAEVVTYRDGTEIPQVTDNTAWENLTTGAWCYYDNDPSKGKLYNWYAVAGIHDNDPNTPNKEFAPVGWDVPNDAEWTTLENYLIANGYNYDNTSTGNNIAKAMASTTGWNNSTGTGAVGNDQSLNNSSGFNTLPGGYRGFDGSFDGEGVFAPFWSSAEDGIINSWYRNLSNALSIMQRASYNKLTGFSVRFVKDN